MSFGSGARQRSRVRIAYWLSSRNAVTEGVATAPAIIELSGQSINVDMPICAAVAAILAETISVKDAIIALQNRPFGQET